MRALAGVLVTLATALGYATSAQAATCTAAGNGDWSTAAVWTGCGGGVPGAADEVVVAASRNVMISDARVAHSLALSGSATITFSGGSVTTSAMTAAEGTVIGNGTLTVSGPFTKATAMSVLHVHDGADLVLNGPSTVDVGSVQVGRLTVGAPAASLLINATFTVPAGFSGLVPLSSTSNGSSPPSVRISPTGSLINLHSGGDTEIDAPIDNDGLIRTDADNRTLTLHNGNSGASSGGSYETGDGADTLEFTNSTFTLGAGAAIAGPGPTIVGGSATVALADGANLTSQTLTLKSNGTLSLAGSGAFSPRTINLGGNLSSSRNPTALDTLNVLFGTLSGNQTLTPTTFTKTGPSTLFLQNGSDLVLDHPTTLSDGNIEFDLPAVGNATPSLHVNSTLTIAPGATASPVLYDNTGAAGDPPVTVGPAGSIVNRRSGGDTLLLADIVNDGVIRNEADTRTLRIGRGSRPITSSGHYRTTAAGQTIELASSATLTSSASIDGPGTARSSGTVTLTDGAVLTSATLTVASGVLKLSGGGAYTPMTINLVGGRIDSARNPTALQTFNAEAGAISGNQTLTPTTFTKTTFNEFTIEDQADLILTHPAVHSGGYICVRETAAGAGAPSMQIKSTYTLDAGLANATPFICGFNLGTPGTRVSLAGPSGSLVVDRAGATRIDLPVAVASGGTLAPAADDDVTFGQLNQTGGTITAANGVALKADKYTQTAGTTTIAAGATFTGASPRTVSGGTLALNGTANGAFTLTGSSVLSGGGTLNGNLVNDAGHVRPGASPGTLTVNGTFFQGAAGTLDIDVDGTAAGTQFDQLKVSGGATLAGSLAIARNPGFVPAAANTFQFLTSASRTGTFGSLTGAGLPGGGSFVLDYPAAAPFGARLLVTGPPAGPPVNNTPPSITGTVQVGQTLTCNPGIWTGGPAFTYAWRRAGTTIAGAAAATYLLTIADAQQQISCVVTATNANGSASTPSPAVTPPAPIAPTVAKPTITGTARLGQTLICSPGAISGSPQPSVGYAWQRTGVAIAGAIGQTYVVVGADLGKALTCRVTASNVAGGADATSNPVTPPRPPGIAAATLGGIPARGRTLTCTPGAITGVPQPVLAYAWLRAGAPIVGATDPTYTITSADLGNALSCRITATNDGGSASATSDPVTPPASRPPATQITGGPDGPTTDSEPAFAFTADGNSTFTCRIDSAPLVPDCRSPYKAAKLADGAHTIVVIATNDDGIKDPVGASRAFLVDTVAPTTSIAASGPAIDAVTLRIGAAIRVTASDPGPGSGVAETRCALNPATPPAGFADMAACPPSLVNAAPITAPGTYVVYAASRDVASNVQAPVVTKTFTVKPDDPEPDTRIGTSLIGYTIHRDVSFIGFTSSIPGSTFQCVLDVGAWTACTSPFVTGPRARGAHNFSVRAISPTGRVDATPAGLHFELDPFYPPDGGHRAGDIASSQDRGCGRTDWDNASTASGYQRMSCQAEIDCAAWYTCDVESTGGWEMLPITAVTTFVFSGFTSTLSLRAAIGRSVLKVGAGNVGWFNSTTELHQEIGCPTATYRLSNLRTSGGWTCQVLNGVHRAAGSAEGILYAQCIGEAVNPTNDRNVPLPLWERKRLSCGMTVHRYWLESTYPPLKLGRVKPRMRVQVDELRTTTTTVLTGQTAACVSLACRLIVAVTPAASASLNSKPLKLRAATASAVAKKPAAADLVGFADIKIRRGKRRAIAYKLTPAGRKLLRKRHSLKVRVTITTPPKSTRGKDVKVTKTVTLRRG